MSARRALVDCAVLSLQDSRVFYPCCRCCFSRIDVEQDPARCSCFKCGYRCLKEQVDYRYRLSLRVARDRCIFGITVFGTCLNPFFGIPASGLQRLVDNLDGPVGESTRSTLLVKAVQDCFIGRHFIFGIKVTGSENGLWSGGPVVNGSSSRDTAQFIASQMILPKAAGLAGCTVVSYYRVLLHKAEEYEMGSTNANKTSTTRLPATTLLLIHPNSPASSFNNTSLPALSLLSQTPQRSQCQDCTLSPTPPWQQSLGLVTSSAEQEEGCSNQDGGDESSIQSDSNNKTPRHALRGCQENNKLTDETMLSPLPVNSLSFAKYPYSSIDKTTLNTHTLNTWFSPPQSVHRKDLPLSSEATEFHNTQPAKTFSSCSLPWDDLPFSESLTEFLGEKDKNVDNRATSPHLNLQETTRSNLETRSQDRNLSNNAHMTARQSQLLVDITNTPAANNSSDTHELSDRVCKKGKGRINSSNNQDEKAIFFSSEDEDGDTYNCSADLFGSSLVIDANTVSPITHTETAGIKTEACAVFCSADKQNLRSEKLCVPHSTPDEHKLKKRKCINKDGAIPPDTQDLDFVPPSQSTSNITLAVVSESPSCSSFRLSSTLREFASKLGSQDLWAFKGDLPELDSRKSAKNISAPGKLNIASANQLLQCSRATTKENLVWCTTSTRRSHRFTPKRKFWKPNKHNRDLLSQQHLKVQRGALNLDSTVRIRYKCDSSACDMTACDYEDNEVPPTPVAKAQASVKLERRQQNDGSNNLDPACHGISCKRTLLHQILTSSQRSVTHTGNCDGELVSEGSLVGSDARPLDDEDQACDWSRDLFSDSF